MAIETLAGEAVRLLAPLLPTAAEPGLVAEEWVPARRLFEAVARPLRRLEEDQALANFVARPFDGDAVQLLLVRSLADNPEFIAELAAAVGQAPHGLTAFPDEYSSPDGGVLSTATWQEPDVSERVCPRCRRNDRIEKVSVSSVLVASPAMSCSQPTTPIAVQARRGSLPILLSGLARLQCQQSW